MFLFLAFVCTLIVPGGVASAQYSRWMASSIISRQQGVMTGNGGSSELLQAGIVQKAFSRLVEQYPDESSVLAYKGYVEKSVESVASFLSNATKDTSYSLDRFSNGNGLIDLVQSTGNASAQTALEALRTSLDLQTRNAAGGLWYYVYPNWSYLDGMYSYAPFYSQYTSTYELGNSTSFVSDILFQFDILWERCLNTSSGLLVHGYDYSKTAIWANVETGASPHVWGRSLGWYAMALVDTLESLPVGDESTEWIGLQCKLVSLLSAIIKSVDPASGAWWQVLDRPGAAGNYIESSGSAMFVYALLRSASLKYVDSEKCSCSEDLAWQATSTALQAYDYIVKSFIVENGNRTISYNGTVAVCSLNSTASYEYYVGQPILYDSVLGSASFVMASLEVEKVRQLPWRRWVKGLKENR